MSDLNSLVYEMIEQHYFMEHNQIKKHFKKITIFEYIAFKYVSKHDNKVYLEDLSEELQQNMDVVSKMIEKLENRGYLDYVDNGKYVSITEKGLELVKQQDEILEKQYGNIINKFGKENTIKLIHLMKKLHKVMDEELED